MILKCSLSQARPDVVQLGAFVVLEERQFAPEYRSLLLEYCEAPPGVLVYGNLERAGGCEIPEWGEVCLKAANGRLWR